MPELPEVETLKRGLDKILKQDNQIQQVELKAKKLRFAWPANLQKKLKGQKILKVERRAKYLLFYLEEGLLINHLGMTGVWRRQNHTDYEKHDHFILHFKNQKLIFNDPRRFGYIDLVSEKNWQSSKYFKHLGPEPLHKDFSEKYLYAILQKKSAPIKSVIMDQAVVVGVGNIYAAEVLFMTKIKPERSANRVTAKEAKNLIANIRIVLTKAISTGHFSVQDFIEMQNNAAYSQQRFLVYGKEGQSCPKCQKKLKNKNIGGRASVYCSSCQK